MEACYCGSGKAFDECCGPIIKGEAQAETAEALMRSRYSAYCTGAIDYLGESLHPQHRDDWDIEATRVWANDSEWLGLQIRSTEAGGPDDEEGYVEFIADFTEGGTPRRHHEVSLFKKDMGVWYYVEGAMPKPETKRHEQPKVGRNDPCPCGSGKKYKKCCGR